MRLAMLMAAHSCWKHSAMYIAMPVGYRTGMKLVDLIADDLKLSAFRRVDQIYIVYHNSVAGRLVSKQVSTVIGRVEVADAMRFLCILSVLFLACSLSPQDRRSHFLIPGGALVTGGPRNLFLVQNSIVEEKDNTNYNMFITCFSETTDQILLHGFVSRPVTCPIYDVRSDCLTLGARDTDEMPCILELDMVENAIDVINVPTAFLSLTSPIRLNDTWVCVAEINNGEINEQDETERNDLCLLNASGEYEVIYRGISSDIAVVGGQVVFLDAGYNVLSYDIDGGGINRIADLSASFSGRLAPPLGGVARMRIDCDGMRMIAYTSDFSDYLSIVSLDTGRVVVTNLVPYCAQLTRNEICALTEDGLVFTDDSGSVVSVVRGEYCAVGRDATGSVIVATKEWEVMPLGEIQ